MPRHPILSVSGLTVKFRSEAGSVCATNGISFDLEKGKTLGIVGESGSGKSVTSLSIMRLLSENGSSSGTITFHEENGHPVDLLQLPEKEMRKWRGKRISMIFQEPMTSLNPVYRCGKQVMENILEHEPVSKQEAKKRTLELFREVLLPDPERVFKAYPHQLSGGQKQRVMIAMALACNPEILIADEPTTALDVTIQKAILQLLKSLQEKHHLSLIFISHDLGVIAEIAHQVLVMYKGDLVEQGSVEQIFRDPQHPYTKGLIACRPPLASRPERLPVIADYLNGNLQDFNFTENRDQRKARHEQYYTKPPLLKIESLRTEFTIKQNLFGKALATKKAVDNVSLEVFKGETLGLVGESGCGKTTLGRSILRLIEPDSGKILYNGMDIRNLKQHELRQMRKQMQIVFQDPYSSLNPRIAAGPAIMEPMLVHRLHENDKTRKQKTIELLEKVGLSEEHFGRYPHEFSGGQRQRICIARALAVEPEFVICDESVSALDVSVQAQVLNLLNDLKREFGLTYIFISHDLSVVKYMSDRIAVMQHGKICELGDADQVYSHPQTAYTQTLIDAVLKGNW